MVTLSTFCGYSAIRIASQLKKGAHLISIDYDEEAVKIAKDLIEFCGLSEKVTVLCGSSTSLIPQLCSGVLLCIRHAIGVVMHF